MNQRNDEPLPPLVRDDPSQHDDQPPFDYTRREPANWRMLVIAAVAGAAVLIGIPILTWLMLRR